jgi:hypothetical protein
LNLFLLALSLFATIWSLIKIRKLNYRRSTTRKWQTKKKKNILRFVVLLNRFRRCSYHYIIDRNLFVFDLQCFCYH